MRTIIALPVLLMLFTAVSLSQKVDSTKKVSITLSDETEMTGYIIAADSATVTIKSLSGVISTIPRKEIVKTKSIKKGMVVGNEVFHQDPADNRLLILPTAVPLKQGEAQFNAAEVFFPYITFGVADFLNLGVGGLPFLANGGGTMLYYASAKISPIHTPNTSVAIGGAIVGATASKTVMGIGYALTTLGTPLASMTLGGFLAFSNDAVYDRPALVIGGSARISKSATLLSENIIILGTDRENALIFLSIGIRFSGENIAADFGTYAIIESHHFFYPIPWIGLSYKF